jgi:hypothetical protein
MFFENEKNLKVLASFLQKARGASTDDEASAYRLSLLSEIIGYIHENPTDWDQRCKFNIKHVGENFLRLLSDFSRTKPTKIDSIYVMSFRFLCEFDFLVGAENKLSIELDSIKNKIEQDITEIDKNLMSQIIYASYIMPANIAKEFINDAKIGVFRDFEQKKEEAESLKIQWDKEIKAKNLEVDSLKDKLNEFEIGFNFVGLYKGFSDLAEKKIKEAYWLFWSLIGMGILILSPLIAEIIFSATRLYGDRPIGIDHLLVLVPIISIEIILIYFFRIIIINHKSVKAQIMQIELRQTLCQFIQSYADYSSKIKQQDEKALEKFENLIFSGILSDPEKIPSTFDGIEQIGKLIKSVKSQ